MADKVLLVGCGNMGHAMLAGWIASGRLESSDVLVVEPDERLRARAGSLGADIFASPEDLPAQTRAALVILAVKPQIMREIVPHYRRFAESGATFLSIAAGTGIALFEELLGKETPVIRCMPNTPAAIGRGMMVVCANHNVDPQVHAFVETLLSASGKVASIADERLMDAVTAVSGSGPAYVFHFIECLAAAGVAAGLPENTALLLARQTVAGAGALADESDEHPARLREQVTSPNGTTAAALAVLMRDDALRLLIGEAVEAARRRGVELGS